MKFILSELEDLFASIQDIVDYIENSKYDNRRYKLYLSSGEYINFSVPNNTIPHLLGIDTTYLQATNIFSGTNSFELLKQLIQNAYKIHSLEKEGVISYNQLFSPFVINKVNSFRENIKLDTQEIEFICKYNPERSYTTNPDFKKYDYIIVKKLPDDRYGMLCLVRNHGYYIPMSSQIFENYDSLKAKLKDIITYQEITLINNIETTNTIDDYRNSFHLNFDDKKRKVQLLFIYKKEFKVSIDVANDFGYTIGKLQQNRYSQNETDILIDKIVESIRSGSFIELDPNQSTVLLPIINAFNDFISSNTLNENEDNNETYSSLISKLKDFERKIKELEMLNSKLLDISDRQNQDNEELVKENLSLKEKQDKIYQILKPSN